MNAPGCYVVHPGHRAPPEPGRSRLRGWLAANRIDPDRVPLTEPVIVLTVPAARHPRTVSSEGADGWSLQIIWFTEHYINPNGLREPNLLRNEVVAFPRTVPLVVPYPTTEETADDGEADSEAAQQAPQVLVRDQEGAEIPHRHEGQGPECAGEGVGPWNDGTEKASSGRGHEAVSQPQEAPHQVPRPQEEVEKGEGP